MKLNNFLNMYYYAKKVVNDKINNLNYSHKFYKLYYKVYKHYLNNKIHQDSLLNIYLSVKLFIMYKLNIFNQNKLCNFEDIIYIVNQLNNKNLDIN